MLFKYQAPTGDFFFFFDRRLFLALFTVFKQVFSYFNFANYWTKNPLFRANKPGTLMTLVDVTMDIAILIVDLYWLLILSESYFTKGLEGGWRAPANRATRGGLTSHTFLSKRLRSVYMLDRVARLPGAPCLLARGTRPGGVAFCHVNGSR